MFRLLSKESHIFSIPLYIFFLFILIMVFNVLDFKTLGVFSGIITFCGIALGYFLFSAIGLNQNNHLPLFLYTFFVFALYPSHLDLGLAISLFTHSFILVLLTHNNPQIRKNSFLIIGVLLGLSYLFLPTTWPMFIFVFIHLVITTDHIVLNLFRYFFGIGLIFGTYGGLMHLLGFSALDEDYFPGIHFQMMKNFHPLYYLSPLVLFLAYAILDHYVHFNKKSPASKFKYSFLLFFFFTQLTTVFFYMGKNLEYLLFLVLPVVIILSRCLRFLSKYWMRELGLWMIVISLVVYRLSSLINFTFF